jgi:hypothetical protein
MFTTVRAALFCAAILLAFAAALNAAPTDGVASVSGMVALNGKPLPAGKLALHVAGAKPLELEITDGKYAGDKVPIGKRIATIKGVGVPAKYGSPETSGLIVEIKAGANVLDLQLKG